MSRLIIRAITGIRRCSCVRHGSRSFHCLCLSAIPHPPPRPGTAGLRSHAPLSPSSRLAPSFPPPRLSQPPRIYPWSGSRYPNLLPSSRSELPRFNPRGPCFRCARWRVPTPLPLPRQLSLGLATAASEQARSIQRPRSPIPSSQSQGGRERQRERHRETEPRGLKAQTLSLALSRLTTTISATLAVPFPRSVNGGSFFHRSRRRREVDAGITGEGRARWFKKKGAERLRQGKSSRERQREGETERRADEEAPNWKPSGLMHFE